MPVTALFCFFGQETAFTRICRSASVNRLSPAAAFIRACSADLAPGMVTEIAGWLNAYEIAARTNS